MSLPLSGQRIGLLTASASRLGGGVYEAVVKQAAMIRALGGEALIFALLDAHSHEDAINFAPSPVAALPVKGPRQIGYAPGLLKALLDARLDSLHLHGIWMYPSRAGCLWARQTGKPYFISPHGMLDPWITARGRWKKALARAGYERANWRAARGLHALTRSEANDIAAESGRNDSLIIPNPAPALVSAQDAASRPPVVAFIGRVHPKKNFLALIEGWQRANLPEGARLVLAGWGDAADVATLEGAVAAAGPDVSFVGPIYGTAKAALLAEARFIALPSLSEGLPMAILESWSAGTPTLMSRHCHLDEGFEAGAAIDCGEDPASVARALEQGLALDGPAWLAMSKAAQGLAAGAFGADTIARRWAEVYLGAPEGSLA